MRTLRVGVIGLSMGKGWAGAAYENSDTELALVYDLDEAKTRHVCKIFDAQSSATEKEFLAADLDIAVVATPDHLHRAQCVAALSKGKHVICEKPLAPTVAECRKIIAAVKKHRRFFMVGQVCRYAPGFRTAKRLLDDGEIGRLAFVESEYAHDYSDGAGVGGWRKDPKIKREGFIGGGCHALDLVRWLAGEPSEVFCYTNGKLLKGWPTDDTGVAVFRFKNGVIGKVFVSVGAKRPYTMRTVIYGTGGTIVCDNTSPSVKLYKDSYFQETRSIKFTEVPVNVASHNVVAEFAEFVEYIKKGKQSPTDVYEGTRTVAFGEAALKSARTGKPVKIPRIS